MELCCSTTLTLIRKNDNATIKEKICDFLKSKPSVCLLIRCYHLDDENCTEQGGKPREVYTHKEESKYEFKFREI